MCAYGLHFAYIHQCVYMVFTLPSDVYVCIRSSICLEMCMCVYGPHFTLRHKCVHMVFTLPSDVYVCIRSSICLEM